MDDEEHGSVVGARGLSFENRIAISSLVTAVVVLLAATGLFMLEQWQAEQRDLRRGQAGFAEVIASQIAPSVARGDAAQARAILTPLVASPDVRAADVFDRGGKLLLHTQAALGSAPSVGVKFFDTRAPIKVGDRTVGEIVVNARAVRLGDILPRYMAVCAALFFAAAGLALFTGRWLARLVVEPVNRLSQAMRDVTDSADYSRPVPTWARDEFGVLTQSFNTLLAQLHANDTALHRAMIELVDARDAAQAANVLKSQFLANMSHEIRTPLNGVLAMAQIISLGELPKVQRERLEVIRRSGEELLAVLNDVLDISKIEAGKMEIETGEVDPDVLVSNLHAMFDGVAAARKNLSFEVELRPSARGVRRGDQARVGQILNNLVSNAIKFTGEGQVRVIVDGYGEGGQAGLRLVVRDTGIGIAPEKLSILFDKFTQADNSNTRRFGGAGLGLALCRELAHMMRGDIEVQSTEGVGSTFIATLPLTRVSAAGQTAAETEHRTLRVLAAEDIPTNQLVLRTIMESFGVELDMVENGRQAVEAWDRGDYDIILMDIQMPEMDGVEATQAIRAAEALTGRPRTPIVAVSANAMAHHAKRYRAVGMDGHVAKPIELAKLHTAIETALSACGREAGGARAA
jgi:signal transduction histidine kinase